MRWDRLFDDLEMHLDDDARSRELDVLSEEERLRLGRLTLRERLMAMSRADAASGPAGSNQLGRHASERSAGAALASAPVRLDLRDGQALVVSLTSFGRDWVAGAIIDDAERHRHALIPVTAIASVRVSADAARRSLDEEPDASARMTERIGLAFALRDLCRRRRTVEIRSGGARFTGTIDRVGRDHLDIAVHESSVPRRECNVTEYRLVPLESILIVIAV